MFTVREVTLQYTNDVNTLHEAITSPEQAFDIFKEILPTNTKECFMALFLNGNHAPIGYQVVSIGTANEALAHPREIFQPAIAIGAVSIIVAHNHPSGNLTFSKQDHDVTKRLKEAGNLLNIRVLDHLILSNNSYKSYENS